MGGIEHHAVGDLARPRDHGAEAEARKDEGVVALADRRTEGLPVATMASPFVHARTSAGSASHDALGFERGNTTGRGVLSRMARMTPPIEGPRLTGQADQHRGLRKANRVRESLRRPGPRGTGERTLVPFHLPIGGKQPLRIGNEDPRARLVGREPLALHPSKEGPGDADAARSGTMNHDALIAQSLAPQSRRIEHPREGDRSRPLDVVVERREHVAEGVEHVEGLILGEVFPLHDRARPPPADGIDESVEEGGVCGAAKTSMAHAEVQRIGDQVLTIGPDVEADGDGVERAETTDRIEASLPMAIATPPYPWSPIPRMADESVTTTRRTSSFGWFATISRARPMVSVENDKPRGCSYRSE